ncbi:MAG: amidohydrolase family protein [Phycisphaerales bacterium]|nr:amidohydrolase family protein [Phycisphaerales bacterium]
MIVDCHTHIWETSEQLGRAGGSFSDRQRGQRSGQPPNAAPRDHRLASEPSDKTFVLALRSYYLEAEVSNDYVADYVRQNKESMIGFACIDPTRPREAIQELRRAKEELGLHGAMVWPAAQDFHPAATSAMRVYTEVSRLRMPLIFHEDSQAAPPSKMEYARPALIDEVAREFSDLKIIISQFGYPWTEETIVLLAKHRNIFTDISGLARHPWHAYNALLSAYQAGVMDGLLFGSNFPFSTAAESIESLYSINQFCHGTNLPTIPREQLRQIVERDALALLGIENTPRPPVLSQDTSLIRSEE